LQFSAGFDRRFPVLAEGQKGNLSFRCFAVLLRFTHDLYIKLVFVNASHFFLTFSTVSVAQGCQLLRVGFAFANGTDDQQSRESTNVPDHHIQPELH